jgi:hypothetical protein
MLSDDNEYQYEVLDKIYRPTANDIGKRFYMRGRVSDVTFKKYMFMGVFECTRCGSVIMQSQYTSFMDAVNSRYRLIKPFTCDTEQGGCGRRSKKSILKPVLPECKHTIYEEINIGPDL